MDDYAALRDFCAAWTEGTPVEPASYIALARPDTIARLLAERDALREALKMLFVEYKSTAAGMAAIAAFKEQPQGLSRSEIDAAMHGKEAQ